MLNKRVSFEDWGWIISLDFPEAPEYLS